MSRVQLFEFNDVAFAPAFLQEAILDSLGEVLERGGIIDALLPAFLSFVEEADVDELLDLGAGSAQVSRILARALEASGRGRPRLILTDLHPRPLAWAEAEAASGGWIESVATPVDATAIPPGVARGRGRMIINALHHFPPALVRRMLADAVQANAPIFVAEGFDRDLASFVPFIRLGTGVLLTNPLRARRARAARAICTWLVPLIPLAAVWDGFVSTQRIHTLPELHTMASEIASEWRWESGAFHFPEGGRGIWFRGLPPTEARPDPKNAPTENVA